MAVAAAPSAADFAERAYSISGSVLLRIIAPATFKRVRHRGFRVSPDTSARELVNRRNSDTLRQLSARFG
jgi:hypothetical protein